MSEHFARQVANLITEDPDILKGGGEGKGGKTNWRYKKELEAEELEDQELLGDSMYFVKFTIGADFYPGEKMVKYYPDGSGYPGSPPETDWDIISIDEVEATDENGEDVAVELTDELRKNITDALLKNIQDEDVFEYFEDELAGNDEPPERERDFDSGDFGNY
jgi:hypothetical protein